MVIGNAGSDKSTYAIWFRTWAVSLKSRIMSMFGILANQKEPE